MVNTDILCNRDFTVSIGILNEVNTQKPGQITIMKFYAAFPYFKTVSGFNIILCYYLILDNLKYYKNKIIHLYHKVVSMVKYKKIC